MHLEVILKMACREKMTIEDFQKYKILSKNDVKEDNSPWVRVTILVSTKQECHDITEAQCRRFAKATGTYVVKWRADKKQWEQAPPLNLQSRCEDADPAFWEYFVKDADAFITDNMSKTLGMVNGTRCRYHSIVPANAEQKQRIESYSQTMPAGSVIVLDEPPLAINVSFGEKDEDNDDDNNDDDDGYDDDAIHIA